MPPTTPHAGGESGVGGGTCKAEAEKRLTGLRVVVSFKTVLYELQEYEEEGTHQTSQISPADCDATSVQLWAKVFVEGEKGLPT